MPDLSTLPASDPVPTSALTGTTQTASLATGTSPKTTDTAGGFLDQLTQVLQKQPPTPAPRPGSMAAASPITANLAQPVPKAADAASMTAAATDTPTADTSLIAAPDVGATTPAGKPGAPAAADPSIPAPSPLPVTATVAAGDPPPPLAGTAPTRPSSKTAGGKTETARDEDDKAEKADGLAMVPAPIPTLTPQAPPPALPATPAIAQTLPAEEAAGRSATVTDAAHPVGLESHRSKLTAADALTSSASSPDTTPAAKSATTLAPPPAVATSDITSATAPVPQPVHAMTTAASTLAAPAPNAPPPPALQVAQAVAEPVRVMLATPSKDTGQPHVTTIQLDPGELGRVEIRIERTNDGPAKVQLAAERPETLLRLVHDQPQLHQALDQAGIPQQGRTISFSLSTDAGASGNAFSTFSGGGSNNGGQRSSGHYGFLSGDADPALDSSAASPFWARSALDITA